MLFVVVGFRLSNGYINAEDIVPILTVESLIPFVADNLFVYIVMLFTLTPLACSVVLRFACINNKHNAYVNQL